MITKKFAMSQMPPYPNDSDSALVGQIPMEPVNKVAIFTGALLFLSILVICYLAAEIILPICIALILNLVFRPVIRIMHRLRIPRSLAAIVIILCLLGGVAALGTALSGPATEWGEKLPTALPKLQERLQFLIRPVATIQKTVSQAENATAGQSAQDVVAVKGTGLSDRLFSSTRILVGGIFETLLVLFFLLISGDAFLQRFLEILPRVQDKKKALQISHQIERDISAYLRTITVMNLLVGVATAIIMHVCQVGDPNFMGNGGFFT